MNPGDFVLRLGWHSLEASLLVGIVLLVQWRFRKQLGPQWSCALWLLVAARLLPISVPSEFSIFNWLPSWRQAYAAVAKPPVQQERQSGEGVSVNASPADQSPANQGADVGM